jgi:hypothetical protein
MRPHGPSSDSRSAPAAPSLARGPAAPDAPSSASGHVSRLGRILKETAADGTESDVVYALIEALAVWHDAESWGYVESLAGPMVRDAALPGSDQSAAPPFLPRDEVPAAAGIVAIAPRERKELGFAPDRDIVLLNIRPRVATPWRIAIEQPEWYDERLLADYGVRTAQALDELAAVELSRAAWALLQHLLPDVESPGDAAQRAMAELAQVMRRPVSLVVYSHDGRSLLTAGDAGEPAAVSEAIRTTHAIGVLIDGDLPVRAVVGARGSHGRLLRLRDERLLHAAAAPLKAWLRSTGRRLSPLQERRRRGRTFEDVVQQYELNAAKLRQDISMIVVGAAADGRGAERIQTWVGHIRQQLRPSDLAGQLAGGDIGILLPHTSNAEAHVVAERVRRLIASSEGFAPIADAAIGLATSSVDARPPQPLLDAACLPSRRAHV